MTLDDAVTDEEIREALRPMLAPATILSDIWEERQRQERKYPGTTAASPDHSPTDCTTLLLAELGEVSEEAKMLRWPWTRKARTGEDLTDSQIRQRLRKELLQVGAIAVAWIERLDAEEAEA